MTQSASRHESGIDRSILRLIPASRAVAGVILFVGSIVAWKTSHPHWVESAGKLLVVMSLYFTYLQFRLESDHAKENQDRELALREEISERGMPKEAAEATFLEIRDKYRFEFEHLRRRVLMNALIMAASGELVAAFGPAAFESAGKLLRVLMPA